MCRSLLVFQDSPEFGGHEKMFLKLAPALADLSVSVEVVFCIPEGNTRFQEAIAQLSLERVRVVRSKFVKGRGEPFFAPARRQYRHFIAGLLAAERPCAALLLQGRIENTLVPMLEASRANVPIASYLPMAHPVSQIKSFNALGPLSEWVRRRYYRIPDSYIVPSHATMDRLANEGVSAHAVHVAPNVVSLPSTLPARHDLRQQLGLNNAAKVALFMGRIDRWQKGLDTLLRAWRNRSRGRQEWRLILVGTGPDSDWLAASIRSLQLKEEVRVVPWTDQPESWYAAADVVLLPSRFEGVPLTMLEAALHRRPVLASAIDVYQDYLPSPAHEAFTPGRDLTSALDWSVSAEAAARYAPFHDRVLVENDLGRSQQIFLAGLQQIVDQRPKMEVPDV
jgi:glycosyltransferase involved in cell wall biosynthesis